MIRPSQIPPTFLACLLIPALVSALELNLPDLEGNQRSLSEYRGKWILLNFWATWCPPCIEEMPELEKFHNKNKETRAVVVGINTEEIDPELLKEFIDELGVTYPTWTASPADPLPIGPPAALPTSYLVSPTGKLVARQIGTITADAIDLYIKRYTESDRDN